MIRRKVKRIILAVSDLNRLGISTILDHYPCLHDRWSDRYWPLHEKNGVYLLKAWIRKNVGTHVSEVVEHTPTGPVKSI